MNRNANSIDNAINGNASIVLKVLPLNENVSSMQIYWYMLAFVLKYEFNIKIDHIDGMTVDR